MSSKGKGSIVKVNKNEIARQQAIQRSRRRNELPGSVETESWLGGYSTDRPVPSTYEF